MLKVLPRAVNLVINAALNARACVAIWKISDGLLSTPLELTNPNAKKTFFTIGHF